MTDLIQQQPTAMNPARPWHAVPVEEALQVLATGYDGLDGQEASRRLSGHGRNRLPVGKTRSALRRFLAQFDNLLIYVLLASAAITLALGHGTDAAVIAAVVLLNAAIGFVQEGRAERALSAIRSMLAPHASVMRGGHRLTVEAETLVPGDLVLLDPGDRVPADLRLLRTRNLRIEEAALTGESVPVDKSPAPVVAEAPLGDRNSVAFSGTLVAAGRGAGVVVATGADTEIGRVSALVGAVETLRTPLLRQMDGFARRLTFVVLGLSAVIFAFAVLVRGYAAEDAFLVVVGVAVAAIPEGLPAVMTIALAIGVRRMAARNAIVRRLPAVETLGSVSIICTDKTGTLTRNEMTVAAAVTSVATFAVSGEGYDPSGAIRHGEKEVDPAKHPVLAELARAALLCNDAALRRAAGGWVVDGDPMEGALVQRLIEGMQWAAPELLQDRFGGLGPDEGFGLSVVLPDEPADFVFQLGDGGEDAAPQALAGQGREEALDGVQPGGRGGREVENPARVVGQPSLDLGMLVGPVIVQDGMDDLARRDGALDGVEELDELLVAMLGHAAADHGAVQHIQRGEQGGGAVALVIVGHGPAFPRLQRQSRLGTVERLDLAFLVDGDDHRMGGRVHVQPDDVLDLGCEGRIVRPLEGADAVGLEPVRLPDALDGAQAQADGLGHRPTRPVCRRARRLRAGQGHDPLHRIRRNRGLARLAARFAQQDIHAPLGEAALPAPDRGTAHPGLPGDLKDRQALRRQQNDPGPLHMLERAVAVPNDGGQPRAVLRADDDADCLGHKPRLAHRRPAVNPLSASMH